MKSGEAGRGEITDCFLRRDFVLGLAVVISAPTSTCGGPFSPELLLGFYYVVQVAVFDIIDLGFEIVFLKGFKWWMSLVSLVF